MRIGLLFGSFDPFHIGHLSLAISALNSKRIDNVWIIPAYQNPWKNAHNASFEHRFNLILEGCKGLLDKIHPTRIEETLYDATTYCTHFIINSIKEKYLEHDFSIITSDETFVTIEDWKFGSEILSNNEFLVFSRPGVESIISSNLNNIHYYIEKNFFKIPISSSKIRSMLFEYICPVPYISADQYRYIKWNNLYGEKFQY